MTVKVLHHSNLLSNIVEHLGYFVVGSFFSKMFEGFLEGHRNGYGVDVLCMVTLINHHGSTLTNVVTELNLAYVINFNAKALDVTQQGEVVDLWGFRGGH